MERRSALIFTAGIVGGAILGPVIALSGVALLRDEAPAVEIQGPSNTGSTEPPMIDPGPVISPLCSDTSCETIPPRVVTIPTTPDSAQRPKQVNI